MLYITDNNLPIITTNHPEIPELRDLLNQVQGDVQDFIESPDSPLGDLSATLVNISYQATEEDSTITLIFDITGCELTASRELAAKEACTANFALPYILQNTFDDISLGQIKYIVTRTSLIFTALFKL